MAYLLEDHHHEIRELVRQLAREKVAPRAAEIDAAGEFPYDMLELLADHDVLGLPVREEYGGNAVDTLSVVIAIEELAAACATTALILAAVHLGALPLTLRGTEEQKRRWLPGLARGEIMSAYCLTEPDAGSDVSAIRTRARRDGDEYVLDGVKRFITNAGLAAFYVVFAVTEDDAERGRMSAFIVEGDRDGLSFPRIEHKMGLRGSRTGDVTLDGVRIPVENRLGEEGQGFPLALSVLDRSRPGIAAQALGIAQGALDYAVDYAWERTAFGKPLLELQGLQWMAADAALEVQAARELLYSCAYLIDDPDATQERITLASAMAKLKAGEVAMATTTTAVQLLGGYGYTTDYPVERMMRDAKICQIYEGTSQIQKIVIGRSLRPTAVRSGR